MLAILTSGDPAGMLYPLAARAGGSASSWRAACNTPHGSLTDIPFEWAQGASLCTPLTVKPAVVGSEPLNIAGLCFEHDSTSASQPASQPACALAAPEITEQYL